MSDLEQAYKERVAAYLMTIAGALETHLKHKFENQPHIDRVTARAKSVKRFLEKSACVENGRRKYTEPLRQIQDQVGARIVTFYLSDFDKVDALVNRYYRPVETQNLVPESEWEFGYFGRHYVLFIPSEIRSPTIERNVVPEFFELQVKTLFQHAWSEANHDLGYKPGCGPLDSDAKRLLAFASAQAWGADRVFNELSNQQES